MKLLIISDSHGNIANLKHVMGFGKKIGARAVVHCGDWNNIKSVETVLSYNIPLYSVLGNADINKDVENLLVSEAEGFNEKFLSFVLGGKKVGVIHNIKYLPPVIGALDIIFFGHWQKQVDKIQNSVRMVNPGALENDVNFAVYDTDTGKVQLINGQ